MMDGSDYEKPIKTLGQMATDSELLNGCTEAQEASRRKPEGGT